MHAAVMHMITQLGRVRGVFQRPVRCVADGAHEGAGGRERQA